MKIHVPYISDQSIGGGYTFYRNFLKGFERKFPEIQFVPEAEEHDILFAFSPTTINGETIERSKKRGAKFVLRMDGVPEDSRNSGRGTRRMVEYARAADFIIYQSDFILKTVGAILKDNGVTARRAVIHNGVDLEIFKPEGDKLPMIKGKPVILNIAYRKDNNKRYEEVLAMYREYWTENKEANLILLGRYPTEWMNYNMGFFNGERFQRMGVATDEGGKAAIIRSCHVMFYPSFADPAPNVVLEAIACGVPVIYNSYGGTHELLKGVANGQLALGNIEPYSYGAKIEAAIRSYDTIKPELLEIARENSVEMMAIRYKGAFDLL